jgi:hypothetical protein
MSPKLRTKRLSEVELGRLVLLGDSADESGPGIGIRGDVLSERAEIIEGVFRLYTDSVSFQRQELNKKVVAIEIDFLLEADLSSAVVRTVEVGDLVISSISAAGGVFVTGPWQGAGGLLDLASAVARPLGKEIRSGSNLVLTWQLVDRHERSKVLYRRYSRERPPERRPRHTFTEDSD